jgi:hypothetical protein
MIKMGWIALAVVGVAAGCAQHDREWDEARAACESEAIQQMETAEPDADQRSTWMENYIRECMDRKGLAE